MSTALARLRKERLHKFAAYLEAHMATPTYGVIARHDPCPRCRGTGWQTVVDPDGYGYDEPCPNGCPQPELPPVEDP